MKNATAAALSSSSVASDEANLRLDRWFKRHYPDLTHGVLQKLLRTGQIRLDGKRVESSTRLQEGQIFRLPPNLGMESPATNSLGAKPMRNRARLHELVLYEDDDVIALNKPAGLAVQGGTGLKENLDDTLMAFSLDGQTKPKLVHRLDRDTSGILLIARNDYAAAKLTEAFRDRATRKIYWAVTFGVPKPRQGRIDAPLIKVGEIMKVAEDEDSKSATTDYKVVASVSKQAAFVALSPITGRTHQLRVHLAFLGTPILGDKLYGGEFPPAFLKQDLGSGLHLHARRLIIPHPRGGLIDVVAPLSKALQKTWRFFAFDENANVDFSPASSLQPLASSL